MYNYISWNDIDTLTCLRKEIPFLQVGDEFSEKSKKKDLIFIKG